MRIPGLTFIIIPLIFWLLYMSYDSIINYYNSNPAEFIVLSICLYILAVCVEALLKNYGQDNINDVLNNTILLLPFILLYKLLNFINKHLTVNL